ncbi:alpha/beta hydrolase-fold protein [Streptomyces sp. SID5910]|uniref:alpha/beta hydrolase-fold protein n=1 Tax=Streptomyces sp. SID5910 TaxID=2690312 RepID=UPI0013721B84|nr:DUF3327 domain-containing protein [Streptomyces sp. SID5910]
MTIVWRQDRPVAGVYALANRVTDKHLAHRGMMRRLDGTDLWHVSLRLPHGLRCSYRVHPFDADDPHLDENGPRAGSSRGLPDDRSDPLNRHAGGPFGSLLELAGAPSLTEWLTPPSTPADGVTDTFDLTATDGTRYRLHRFVPHVRDPATELDVLIVCDGDQWFGRYGIARAVSTAMASGRIPPLAVIGVEAGVDVPARIRQLGANRRFVDTLADEILPAVTADLPHSGRTVLSGQSLGGLTSLVAALWRPDTFGTVLAHSASTWWRPGMTGRPMTPTSDTDTWLHEQATTAPLSDVTIRMDVGSNEGITVDHLRKLHALLTSRGFDTTLDIYEGGHDFCCWAAALMEGLGALTWGE